MWLWIIIAGTIAILVVSVKFLLGTESTIRNVDPSKIDKYIEMLLYRGADGAFLVIKKRGHQQFVQFSKNIVKKGTVELRLSFPEAKWSTEYIERVKELLRQNQVEFSESSRTANSPISFIDASLSTDIGRCAVITSTIFDKIFAIASESTYVIRLSRIGPSNVKIGFE